MTMIEKVARLLEPQAWAALGPRDTLAYRNRRTSSLRKARAVIEVMREPTVEMLRAADAVILTDEEFHSGPFEMTRREYIAMIDKALEDTFSS